MDGSKNIIAINLTIDDAYRLYAAGEWIHGRRLIVEVELGGSAYP